MVITISHTSRGFGSCRFDTFSSPDRHTSSEQRSTSSPTLTQRVTSGPAFAPDSGFSLLSERRLLVLAAIAETALAIDPVTSEMLLKSFISGLGSQRSRSSGLILANYSGWKDFYCVSKRYSLVFGL